MHNLPLQGIDNFPGQHWQEWNGPLTDEVDTIIHDFLASLVGHEDIPEYALLISQLSVSHGGLGLLYPSHRAAPDFVITMKEAYQYATKGFTFNEDLDPFQVHPTIASLFSLDTNPNSKYLQRFHRLLPHLAHIACPPKCPSEERHTHFLHKISTHSARSRIKKHCSSSLLQVIYDKVQQDHPEHLPHLPSMLSPHMSYPLINMCRSVPAHRLHNWNFLYAILRKLRLPIYDPLDCPPCHCGQMHDCYGDHAFCCVKNNKKMAHNFIRDGWASCLQSLLATAGYILPTSTLETETPNLVSDSSTFPLDISFNPDPSPSPFSPPPCPYPIVGADITIAPPPPASDFSESVDVCETVTAAAEKHLQTKERQKLMRSNRVNPTTLEVIDGDNVIRQLVQAMIIMIPFAIDPHGRWGPMTHNFLFGHTPRRHMTFSRQSATDMYSRAYRHPCPLAIIPTASAVWKHTKDRQFFGHSYTAPTPREHALGQLGLVLTKAYGLHLRNATRKMGPCDTSPPGLDTPHNPHHTGPIYI